MAGFFIVALVCVALWLVGTAERDLPRRWVFERSYVARDHEAGTGPFRASEPVERSVGWYDHAERRALVRARVASVAFVVLAVSVAVGLARDLPEDASSIVVAWALVCAALMIRDQLCREWWMIGVGPVALFFAFLIDPEHWTLALLVWLLHLGLRLAVELRMPSRPDAA